ncbi:type I-E CRISPR-associated protein Cse1/CasA [Streptomyces bohaiensis]|uniref:type I-E CRISPR-associated protein Cse1/CasA n=1 Tax=Streptomyces bohaiensis TaxID=1431344 RepID=UPI0028AB8662|nr:type I-E CRISPR-associated protein Cse1/CasA [Streptomyces bohaiensis]
MSFNLLSQPWALATPVATSGDAGRGGVSEGREVGARELLLDAHLFAEVAVEVPTLRPAMFRQVLLPIVVDALGYPSRQQWAEWFHAGAFPPRQRAALESYLDEHYGRFDLFAADDPFAQVGDLRTAKGETKGSALLVASAATGNNVPLFSSRSEADVLELTPAQAARWLLHTHCWDTAAIKTGAVGDPKAKAGKTTGNPTGPLGQLGVVMPMGRTVYETLLLNIPYDRAVSTGDLPQWRRRSTGSRAADALSCATAQWQTRAARGLLDLWTWQARRVRLLPQDTPSGVRVTQVIVAAGDRLDGTPQDEPHTTWRLDSAAARAKKQTANRRPAPAARPRRHQPGKAAWRGMEALLTTDRDTTDAGATRDGYATSVLLAQLAAASTPENYPLQLQLTGVVYGNQSAVVEDTFFDEIPLPITALNPGSLVYGALLTAAEQAEHLASAVNNLSADLRRAAGGDPIPWDQGQRPGDTLLHALDPVMRRLLAGLRTIDEDFDAADRGLLAWEQRAAHAAWQVAEHVLAGAGPAVFTGRTVEKDGKERVYRLSNAERSFRARLDAILVRRAATRAAARKEAAEAAGGNRDEHHSSVSATTEG